ncbi:hypothetical protein JR316_0011561 [Psilocybe cubensis]|uniref:Uncharacterized protein n=2 Tax=Psilocybe cubensis TaxID=181762 RepID=A0ACB8GKH0_PSICU|nr:hypothetical protein JR316_0011561 [Psilocybe cubensis]KAH9475994.1 hypothetical protein JR316_0011561 [Psilocybe cubensis]
MLYAVLRTSWTRTRGPLAATTTTFLRPVGVSSLLAGVAATATRRTFLTSARVDTPASSSSSKSSSARTTSKDKTAKEKPKAKSAEAKEKAKAKSAEAKEKAKAAKEKAKAAKEKAKAAKEKAKAAKRERAEAQRERKEARKEAQRKKKAEKAAAEKAAKQNAKNPFRKPMNAFNNFLQQAFKDATPEGGKYVVPAGSDMRTEFAKVAQKWASMSEEEKQKYAVDPKSFQEYHEKVAAWRATLTNKERKILKSKSKSSGIRGVNLFFKDNFPKSLEGTTFADVTRDLRAKYNALSAEEIAVYDERARVINDAKKEEKAKAKAERKAAKEAAAAAASAASA